MCIFIKMNSYFLHKAIFELTEASKRYREVVDDVLSLRQKRTVRMERKLVGLKGNAVL